ncbi:MAG: hypothetical protein MUP81_02885 [Dehalococcoidia bacterium]|nr:hypothetical protein [Dehalococcoidia bacterium]
MKTLRRWWANIRWLFNSPPIKITGNDNPPQCDYCDRRAWLTADDLNICQACIKKAIDKTLGKKK